MKKYILKITLGVVATIFGLSANAQCPTIACPSDITVNNDSGACGAVVNYTAPVGIDSCAGSQTFNYTGSLQTFVVPAGVTSVTITAYGAQGEDGVGGTVGTGGEGGMATGDLAVTPGQTLNIYVGGQNGYNGGGSPGASGPNDSGMGGGASDVRVGGTTLNDRVIVAAGGGGGAGGPQGSCASGPGGSGGNGGDVTGLTGTTGAGCGAGGTGGTGGTASSGGTGGAGNANCSATAGSGLAGALGIGGNGGDGIIGCAGYTGSGGGGGGGGYYGGAGAGGGAGGGGGAWSGGGGGGGSSYITGLTAASTTAGGQTGDGEITITWTPTLSPTTSLVSGLGVGATFPIGITTETYEVISPSGDTAVCSFTVTVVDNEIPTITCPANVSSCDPLVTGIAPTAADNCPGETVSYTLTGATTGSGSNDASGTTFNLGTTNVQYTVTDTTGNMDSCSFDVTINALPVVGIAAFTPDTVCDTDPAITLPVGTPASGIYSGNGVGGGNFDPATAGVGGHYVTYTVTDTNGCTSSDSTLIVVETCVGLDDNAAFANVSIYPNPTNNLIHINLGNHNGVVDYTITTIDGRLVEQKNNINTNNITIDLTHEGKGIYFLKLNDLKSSKVYKLMKE